MGAFRSLARMRERVKCLVADYTGCLPGQVPCQSIWELEVDFLGFFPDWEWLAANSWKQPSKRVWPRSEWIFALPRAGHWTPSAADCMYLIDKWL